MQRITEAFASAKAQGRGAFIAYLTSGYPNIEESERAADEIISSGADIIELGVPFSDPFADGGVIRSAAYEALSQGVSLSKVLDSAARLRSRHPKTGVVLFSYYNPVFSMGLENFAAKAADADIDGVLIVDLPLEERDEIVGILKAHGISYIPLIAPNTPVERIKESERDLENSFLYVITVKGTTGERSALPEDLATRLDRVRSVATLPIAAGFGISTKAQAAQVCEHADGFVVGSALVKCLAEGRAPCLA